MSATAHGIYPIIEIAKTQQVVYNGGLCKVGHPHGGKLKCTSTGVVMARYVFDPPGTIRAIKISVPDEWGVDRIGEIYQSGTTIPMQNIIIGY